VVAAGARDFDERWGDGLSAAVVASIARAHQIVQADVARRLAPFKLNTSLWAVLTLLSFSKSGELPLGRIASRTMLHPATITNTIDRLERLGFVKRVSDPSDGRGKLARITPQGRAVVEEVGRASPLSVFDQLTEQQLDLIFRSLSYVRAAAGDSAERRFRGSNASPRARATD